MRNTLKNQERFKNMDVWKAWVRVRKAFATSAYHFYNTLLGLSKEEAEGLLEVCEKAVNANSIEEVVERWPEMRAYLHGEADRECMLAAYDFLMDLLNKEPKFPRYKEKILKFRGAFWKGVEK